MKKRQLLLFFVITIFIVSCTHRVYVVGRPLPPGQAKKVAGTQSAKPFAPGQQKKKGKTVVVVTN
jgi:hypothetical protein